MEFRKNDTYLRFSSGFSVTFLLPMYSKTGIAVSLDDIKQRRGRRNTAPRVLTLD